MPPSHDVVVIGAGPNGLSAAITCARAGLDVLLVEGSATVGGGSRSAALTEPGFVHDVCSAIHPLALVSPFFKSVSAALADHGLAWAFPEVPLSHPLDGGRAALLERSFDATGATLEGDGLAYERLFAPFVRNADALYTDVLAPLRFPHHPALFTRIASRRCDRRGPSRAVTSIMRRRARSPPAAARTRFSRCTLRSPRPSA
jgi:phytoene dehydrogenase-like protein